MGSLFDAKMHIGKPPIRPPSACNLGKNEIISLRKPRLFV
jgi:hypothetical protein